MVWRTEGKSDKKRKKPKLKKQQNPQKISQKQQERGRQKLPINIHIKEKFSSKPFSSSKKHHAFPVYTAGKRARFTQKKAQENKPNSLKACGNHFAQLTTRTKPHRSPKCQHRCPCSPVNFHPVPAPGDLKHRPYTCFCGFIYPM